MKSPLSIAISASIEAGKAILEIYHTDFKVEFKADESPLTLADRRAHDIISARLSSTSIPVLSEEGRNIPYEERAPWPTLWIVDPLDGTKEFVKKNDEFTVNIALVREGSPVLGVIYVPVTDVLYFGDLEKGSYRVERASINWPVDDPENYATRLPLAASKSYFGVVASRSHLNPETEAYIDRIRLDHGSVDLISKGSSLKLCLIAEGTADVYPRFGPTSEWDVAAGHAIILAAGGRVMKADYPDEALTYNKRDLLNPWFVAFCPKI